MARIYIGGLSGCGKTEACRRFSLENNRVVNMTGSEIMMQAAGVKTRDELANLPEKIKENLREIAFTKYYSSNPNLIIDGHFYITQHEIDYLDAFVLIEIDNQKLIRYRSNDEGRIRSLNIDDITQELTLLNQRISEAETRYNIEVIRINNDGSLIDLVEKISQVYSRYGMLKSDKYIHVGQAERI